MTVAVGGLTPPCGYGADKLTVKDSGANVKFIVRDTGVVGVDVPNPVYNMDVASGGAATSAMHFSMNGNDVGGWFTSVLDNNFFVSSGAAFIGGTWVQKSSDTNSVMAGSGGVGYRIFTHTGTAVGSTFTPTLRLHIDYNGNMGINTMAVPGTAIVTATGATLTAGGAWTNASSRALKDHVTPLSSDQALQAFSALNPVTFHYKAEGEQTHVGFIAEDVPDLVATPDRKGLSAMDIVAVLTKVVQEKSAEIDSLAATVSRLESELNSLKSRRDSY
jgi:hypothetical protein